MTPALPPTITEDDIADYLLHTPDFFQRHAELLAQVQLASPHQAHAVSLQERQAVLLRDKIKLLEQRLMELMRAGNDNLLLTDKLLQWSMSLLHGDDAHVLPQRIAADVVQRFDVPQVALRLWGLAPAFAGEPYAQGVSEDARLFVASLREPFCGVNSGFEVAQWLEQPQAAASLALLPLRRQPQTEDSSFGLLVLASPDAQRFASTLATDFLQRVADLASAALLRLL